MVWAAVLAVVGVVRLVGGWTATGLAALGVAVLYGLLAVLPSPPAWSWFVALGAFVATFWSITHAQFVVMGVIAFGAVSVVLGVEWLGVQRRRRRSGSGSISPE